MKKHGVLVVFITFFLVFSLITSASDFVLASDPGLSKTPRPTYEVEPILISSTPVRAPVEIFSQVTPVPIIEDPIVQPTSDLMPQLLDQWVETPITQDANRDPFLVTPSDVSSLSIAVPSTAQDLAVAMGMKASDIQSVSLNGSDIRGTGIETGALGKFFPTEGNSFAILSSGYAESADDPNDTESLSGTLEGIYNSQGNDLVQLDVTLKVPSDMNCASFDFAFYSEEFPEFVGSQFNDGFTAEFGESNLSVMNDQIVAPQNFAFDTVGNVVSVNTVFGVSADTGTTYDGGTTLLRAHTAVAPNSEVRFVFSVQDLGDSIYDSAVFLDKFFWSQDSQCGGSAEADTDGDGLLDNWETQGLTVSVNGSDVFVDLPAMGANPYKKDVFVEIDYMVNDGLCVPNIGCVLGHSHQPKVEAINKIIEAFQNSPVGNVSGNSDGINLHVDAGPDSIMNPETGEKWGSFSQSNKLPHDDDLGNGVPNKYYDWSEFDSLKSSNFSEARSSIFHYCIFAHRLGGFGLTSGLSRDAPASDFIVTLGGFIPLNGTTNTQAGTFMHELGHNLGLRHGGNENTNNKPNYISIMNYSFQTQGLIIGGQGGNFDYSRSTLPDLDENNLDETKGLNPGADVADYGTRYFCAIDKERIADHINAPINWNCDWDTKDQGITENINEGHSDDHDTSFTILRGYNDWSNLVFTGGAIGQPGAQPDLPSETEVIEMTKEQDAKLLTPYRVGISTSGNVILKPGDSLVHTISVTNLGEKYDTYTLSISATTSWPIMSGLPNSISIDSGSSIDIPITVNVPASASPGEADILTFTATSQSNMLNSDSVDIQTKVLIPEVISIKRVGTNPTLEEYVDYLVTFSVDVSGVDISDFTLTNVGDLINSSVTAVSGSNASYTVTVNTGEGIGAIRLDLLDDDSIVDLHGYPIGGIGLSNGDFTSGEIYMIDAEDIIYTISGNTGEGGVTLSYTIGSTPVTAISESNGNYSLTVPIGWSGSITPSKQCGFRYSLRACVFMPSSRNYTDVTNDQYDQNYTVKVVY